MSQNHNVIVTGGAGYIGSHVVYALLDSGFTPIIIDDLSTGSKRNLPKEVLLYEFDVGDTLKVSKVLKDHLPLAVMHFAGSIVVSESVDHPEKYYKNNTVNSLSLIRLCAQENIPGFIFSSTAAVYGEPETVPISETATLNPINPYGWSKLMTEQMLQDIAKTCEEMNYGILRYFNVAGADPELRSGQSGKNATHLIKIASEVATNQRDQMSIFGTDYPTKDGTCIRDYIHVSDLADVHVKLLQYIIRTKSDLIANCGYGHGYSVKEVISAINETLPKPIKVINDKRRPGDPAKLISSNTKLKQTLGWTPKYDNLDTIVRTAIAWEEHNR